MTKQKGNVCYKSLFFLIVLCIPVLLTFTSCSHLSVVKNNEGKPLSLEISTIEKISLNGTDQWIYIEGCDKNNPVLIWLDGGPGGSEIAVVRKYLGPLHERFTVVCSDQRETGKSFGAVKDYSKLTVDDYVNDVIALSEAMRKRFGKDKVYLVGHSWGSIIGLKAAAATPELFAAYTGIGQQINGPENDRIGWEMVHTGALAKGKAKVAKQLEKNGLPPYDDGDRYMYLFDKLWGYSPQPAAHSAYNSMDMFAGPEHNPLDRLHLILGLMNGVKKVYPKVARLDFEKEIKTLGCPLFIVNGRYDYTCVATIAERWFNAVDAPMKELVWFENSDHESCYTESGKFIDFMTNTVLAKQPENKRSPEL